jgi:hypothetical protein
MADKKITALTENTALAAADLFHVVDSPSSNPSNQKVTVNSVFMSIPAPLAFSSIAAVVGTTTLSLTVAIHNCGNATTAQASALAAGSVGQFMFFTATTDENTVITPAATGGAYATATLTIIGETLTLMYHATTVAGWYVMGGGSGVGASAASGAVGGPLTTD